MESHLTGILIVSIASLALYLLLSWPLGPKKGLLYPPGPKGLPILGNFFDMMGARECETLRGWKATYGPIAHLKVFGRSYVYLNDYQTVVNLFEKRGNIYSSRPHFIMNDLQGWGEWFVGVLPYGPELRRSRQKLHHFLQQSVVPDYFAFQTQSSYRLAELLLRDPEDFLDVLKYSAADLITRVTYGYAANGITDPIIRIAEEGMEAFADAQGFYMVNEVPWLQHLPPWIPGMGFMRIAEEGYKKSMDMYKKPYEMFKKNLGKGLGSSSIAARLLESLRDNNGKISQEDEDLTAKVTSIMYAGAADTSFSALSTFILAMVLHPDVQKRAQEEIDKTIGRNTLPTFEDLPKLKYIDAIRKECMRWQSIITTPSPHTVSIDDEINGYLIPANSVVMANFWAIFRDPVEYPEPDKFIPERFIPSEGKKVPLEPSKVIFSVGRRICPGRYFAENSIFIDMATIIATCDIRMALDVDGNLIIPDINYTNQFIRHTKPFRCSIKPRNSEILGLLHQHNEVETSSGD
ncbi:cytochrome P450 [Pyrrhoderma noxium]|uniref:Cytochrome P450 n=1 Tax=Pyrrhoderma noxium TaxID=2282107 RepID=A0A286U6V6_9AGAM|nr:cytochrome P450 [Pyrrhoderma noxium]